MESAKPIIWSPEADKDLEQTLDYLGKHWPITVAQHFISHLFNTLDWIALHPDTFIQLNSRDNIRKYVLSEHYTLYFEVFDSHIALLRIFHNRQDPQHVKF